MEADLSRLAQGGLGAFPPRGLPGLAEQCRARGTELGLALAEIVELIWAALWDADENDHAPAVEAQVDAVNHELRMRIPAILDEADPEAAAYLAASLREAVLIAARAR